MWVQGKITERIQKYVDGFRGNDILGLPDRQLEKCRKIIVHATNQEKDPTLDIAAFDIENGTATVRYKGQDYNVNLFARTCTCGEFQELGMCCVNAIHFTSVVGLNPFHYADPRICLSAMRDAYAAALPGVIPAIHTDELESTTLIRAAVPAPKRGARKKRRIMSAAEAGVHNRRAGLSGGSRRYQCGRCKYWGHAAPSCDVVLI
jgi:hypothetical protein